MALSDLARYDKDPVGSEILVPGPITALSHMVKIHIAHLWYVLSVNDQIQESWRLLVKERIANIAKLRTPFFVKQIEGFWVFVNKTILHSEGGSLTVGIIDR